MHRGFPGTCPAESRPASEERCVTRAQQVSACRWAGDGASGARRRGLTGGPARSPERAICCALDCELRGIHGCPTAPQVRSVPSSGPGRPRESAEPGSPRRSAGLRGAARPALRPPGPLAQLCLRLLPLLSILILHHPSYFAVCFLHAACVPYPPTPSRRSAVGG